MKSVDRLMKTGPQRERGAVAVVVALLSVVLIGISAFSIDFGMSYVSTRQLQVASDAAVLAATASYKDAVGNCTTLAANTTLRTQANTVGQQIMSQNRAGAVGGIASVECTSDLKGLEITFNSSGSTPAFFGPVFGRSTDYTTSRPATAELRVPNPPGVRPYLLCSAQIPSTIPSAVFKVELPSDPAQEALCGAPPGNWWTINCPEDASSSNAEMAHNTANGCDDAIGIVPGQGTKTGLDLRTHLVASCPPLSQSCLEGNTGEVGSDAVRAAWKSLVDNNETIILPVFCGKTRCDQPAYTGTGSTARYPVHSLVAVRVCGYHWGSGGSPSNPKSYPGTLSGDCASAYTTDVAGNDNFLLLKATRLQVSGKSDDSDCAVGDPLCDNGLRKIQLTK